MRKHRARLLALAFAPLSLLVLELALRVAGFDYPPLAIPIVVPIEPKGSEGALHRPDDAHFWLPREGARIPWTAGEHVTPGGYRGADPDPNAPIKLVLLGDSSSFGWGLTDEETAARRLERALEDLLVRERGPAPAASPTMSSGRWLQVLNAGVVGSTSVQGVARYRGLPRDFRPDVVIEAFGAINDQFTVDFSDREKLARSAAPLARAFAWLRAHARLAHAAAWVLDQRRGGRDAIQAEQMKTWRRGRRTSANEVLEALGRDARTRPALEQDFETVRVSPDEFDAALEELRELVRTDGARLLCLAMPRARSCEERYPRSREYDAVVAAFAERNDLVLVDARKVFRAAEDAGTPETELYEDGIHPSADGAARIADMLLEALTPIVRELAQQRG